MKYVALDVETTGLTPETCQVLSIGAIIDDLMDPRPLEELSVFNVIVGHSEIHGEPYALMMNHELIRIIATQGKDLPRPGQITPLFLEWLLANEVINRPYQSFTVAGKNVGSFDIPFLRACIPGWSDKIIVKHRSLDPSILYARTTDPCLPSLGECKKRAGIEEEVTHNALEDAWDVVRLLRLHFAKKEMFPDGL